MKEIQLTQGQVALVDDEDYDMLMQWNWCAIYDPCIKSFYAASRSPRNGGKQMTILMHRVIMDAQKGQPVDHGDHDTLNNRRDNLRLTTNQGNHMNRRLTDVNTSGFCGVCLVKRDRRWHARIKVDGAQLHLGSFANKADAIAAREAANVKYGFHKNHGKRKCLPNASYNHPRASCP